MHRLWVYLFVVAAISAHRPASGEEALERTDAFEHAYAASFYQFDACGDGLAGRIYRKALEERFAQCPFSQAAKARLRIRLAAQRRKSSQAMAGLIDKNGGLPVRLEGMTRTCREQFDSPEYRAVHARLDSFSAGTTGPQAVIAEPCDATEITP